MAVAEQMFGLNEWARHYVSAAGVKIEKSGETYVAVLAIAYYLNTYTLPNGRLLREQVQVELGEIPGRAIYVALRDESNQWVPDSLWSEEERWLSRL